jgi:hypothetical protein
MFRIFCIALSAFALLAGVAAAKTHTVVVTSVALDKATVDAGGSLTATYKVKNNLSKKANPRTVRFFLTLDEDAKRGFNGVTVGTTKTPKIGAKSTKTLIQPLTVPAKTAAGSYLVLACISGECQATGLRVTVVARSRTSSDLSVSPSAFDFGAAYTQSAPHDFIVTNTSSDVVAGPVDVSFEYTSGGPPSGGHFGVDSSSCSMLVPHASCLVTVSMYTEIGEYDMAARMSATDPNTPVGSAYSDLTGGWGCGGLFRARPTPRC